MAVAARICLVSAVLTQYRASRLSFTLILRRLDAIFYEGIIVCNSNLMSGLGGSSDYGEVTMTRGDNNYQLFDFTSVLGETLDLGGQRIGLDDDYWIAPSYDDYTSFGSIGTDLSLVHIGRDAAAEATNVTWDRMPWQDSHSPFFISSYFELNSFQVQLQRADDGSFDISTRYGDSAGLGSLVGYSMGDGYVADIVGAVSDWSVSITRDTRIIGTLNDDDLRAETRVVVDELMFGGQAMTGCGAIGARIRCWAVQAATCSSQGLIW
ncbi:hypothetical protein ABMC88_11170 [Sulfitobacter sp. HNIBRBA2951]|uniref:hypothetical protein n=1 Tax=Sulfitobacter aquimarinus TaxID=3158557 RepID=UPI0032E0068E